MKKAIQEAVKLSPIEIKEKLYHSEDLLDKKLSDLATMGANDPKYQQMIGHLV